MDLVNWILNLAGVLLWIDWRSGRAARQPAPVLSLASAVRPVEKQTRRALGSLGVLLLLLLVRPLFYWTVGGSFGWTPRTDLLAISLPWRTDLIDRAAIFSTVSFLMTLAFYYAALLLLSVAGSAVPSDNAVQRFVRIQLGFLDKLPAPVKLLLPSAVAFIAWAAFAEFLVMLGVLPPLAHPENLWGEALALAIASLLVWKWVLVLLCVAHLLNLYIYLGTHPVWTFISAAARRLLWPFSFLAFGRVDLSPVAGIIAVFVLSELAIKPLANEVFQHFLL